MYAITYFPKDMTVIKALLAKNANIAAMDKIGNTALSGAIAFNRLPAFKLLIRYGADINAPNGRGFTPLMMAVGTNNFAMFTILMDKGADPTVAHVQGWTVLQMNRARMHPQIKARLDRIAPQNKKKRSSQGVNIVPRR
jgi:ankyrin repeat protein